MAGRVRGWLALTWRERAQFVGLVIALIGVHGVLAMFGYMRTRRWLEHASARTDWREPDVDDLANARRLAELTAIAGRHGLVTATCLRQALVVYACLRRQGLDAELKIGMRKGGAAFDAHAWVELGGHSIDAAK